MHDQERRHHVAYITRNTEYHCRDGECVGVRDRNSGTWQIRHPALRATLVGGIRRAGGNVKKKPSPGARLVFKGNRAILTSRVLTVERPERESVRCYTSLCWAGCIGG